METATQVYRVNVCAFIMTHGIVTPKKPPVVQPVGLQPVGLQPTHYTVTTRRLPPNITLYAPAILGYSYYEDKQTEHIVTQAARKAQADRSLQAPHQYIAEKFLHDLQQYVNYKISRLSRYLSLVDLPHGDNRAERLDKQETITMRTQMEWREHSYYIEEKEYQIYPDQEQDPLKKLPSCIMIYCDTVNENAMDIINARFNHPKTTYASEKGEGITYTVNYEEASSTFKIDFGDSDVDNVTLDDIIFLIKNLILNVGPHGTTFDNIMLSIFDLTCDDLSFPEISEADQRPVLLSSVKSDTRNPDPKLVYGTIQESRALQIERETRTCWPRRSSIREDRDSRQSQVVSLSPSRSRSASPVLNHSQSPAAAEPSNTHVVHLLHGAESFVNFNLLLEFQNSLLPSSSKSVSSTTGFESLVSSVSSTNSSGSSDYGGPGLLLMSPERVSIPRPGGSRRSHSRHRRTKKVTRNNGRKSNRRHTKVRSKRSKRQRKTKR